MISINTFLKRSWMALVVCFALTASQLAMADSDDGNHGLHASDRQAILDLISAYSYTYDSKDLVRWLSLFTKDTVWAWYAGPSKTLAVQLVGRDTMKAYFEPRLATLAQQGIQSRHYQTNTVFTTLEGKKATARTIVLVTWQYAHETTPRPVHTGIYEDKFVKTKDGWKFKERVLFNDHN